MSIRWQPVLVLAAAALLPLATASATPDAPTLSAPDGVDDQEAPACSFQASGEELTGRASPPDSSSVTVGGHLLKICYSSPRKRDRNIFGGLVAFDRPWRLGANEPTTLHVTGPVRVGGVELTEGSYAVYAIPGEESWEIVFNDATERWGVPIDASVRENDVGSATATPESTESTVEEMTLTLTADGEDGAKLSMAWDDTRWSVPISAAGGGDTEGDSYDGS